MFWNFSQYPVRFAEKHSYCSAKMFVCIMIAQTRRRISFLMIHARKWLMVLVVAYHGERGGWQKVSFSWGAQIYFIMSAKYIFSLWQNTFSHGGKRCLTVGTSRALSADRERVTIVTICFESQLLSVGDIYSSRLSAIQIQGYAICNYKCETDFVAFF